jgi:hypothetical protein
MNITKRHLKPSDISFLCRDSYLYSCDLRSISESMEYGVDPVY